MKGGPAEAQPATAHGSGRRRALAGLRDKLYWRPLGHLFHCFARVPSGSYASLCGHVRGGPIGGQAINRPAVVLRCLLCDAHEARRRGWSESGPERGDWLRAWEAHYAREKERLARAAGGPER